VITLTLMTEWRDWPLQVVENDGLPDSYAIDEIGEVVRLSGDLLAAIGTWDEAFQSTYVEADPARSGFVDETARERFIADGRRLAERIKREAGQSIVVEYAGDGSIPPETVR